MPENTATDSPQGPHISVDDIEPQREWMGMGDVASLCVYTIGTISGAYLYVNTEWYWGLVTLINAVAMLNNLRLWGTRPTVDEAQRQQMANIAMNFLDDVGIEETTATATDEQGRERKLRLKKIDGNWKAKEIESC